MESTLIVKMFSLLSRIGVGECLHIGRVLLVNVMWVFPGHGVIFIPDSIVGDSLGVTATYAE